MMIDEDFEDDNVEEDIDFDNCSPELFDELLAEVLNAEIGSPAEMLGIPGIYEIVSDYYNNNVAALYEELERSKR